MIQVVLVGEFDPDNRSVSSVVAAQPDMEVAATCSSTSTGLVWATKCNIVLASTHLPEMGALRLAQNITQADLPARVLVVGVEDAIDQILPYVEAGAAGYVVQGAPAEEVVQHIRAIDRGYALISPEVAAALMVRARQLAYELLADAAASLEGGLELTPREAEILELLGLGKSNQDIADYLHIELGTVKNHVHSILEKLDVDSRKDAAAYLAILR